MAAIRREGDVRMGDVRFAGVVREVCLECLEDVAVGDYVLVHVGFAISKIDREEAERAYRALDLMGHTKELTADRSPLPGPAGPDATGASAVATTGEVVPR